MADYTVTKVRMEPSDQGGKHEHIAGVCEGLNTAILSNCGPISSSHFVKLDGNVVVTGVGFWDEIHGQTGVAPNGIELHPVLGFTGDCHPATGGGGGGGGGGSCSPSYPDFCIPPPPPDLDCADVAPHVNFTVLPPDPHGFDGNNDGVGCEA